MRTLIDGYNVMHAKGLMDRKFGPDGLRKVRDRFLAELVAAISPIDAHQTTVVFDAADPPRDRPSQARYKGLTIVYAVDDENADERIEKLIAAHSNPKSLTVVSTDLRVRQAAERRRAKVVLADDFLAGLTDRRSKKDEPAPSVSREEKARMQGLSGEEAQFWLKTFAHVGEEPGMKEALRASDFVPTDEEIARIEREIREEDL